MCATNGTQTHNLVLGEQNFIPLNYGGGADYAARNIARATDAHKTMPYKADSIFAFIVWLV